MILFRLTTSTVSKSFWSWIKKNTFSLCVQQVFVTSIWNLLVLKVLSVVHVFYLTKSYRAVFWFSLVNTVSSSDSWDRPLGLVSLLLTTWNKMAQVILAIWLKSSNKRTPFMLINQINTINVTTIRLSSSFHLSDKWKKLDFYSGRSGVRARRRISLMLYKNMFICYKAKVINGLFAGKGNQCVCPTP